MPCTEKIVNTEADKSKTVIILNPPMFSHMGKLTVGQTISCIYVDVIARYTSTTGKALNYASASYNAQGKPIDSQLDSVPADLVSSLTEARKLAIIPISAIEAEKTRLEILNNGTRYVDFDPIVRRNTQDLFLRLYHTGVLERRGRELIFMTRKIPEDLIHNAVDNIDFHPRSAKTDFIQILRDADDEVPLTKPRVFATPLPLHLCSECDMIFHPTTPLAEGSEYDPRIIEACCPSCKDISKNIPTDTLSPLFDLAIQAYFLRQKSDGHTIMISGKNVLIRYPYLSFMIGCALDGHSPFDTLVVHSLLADEEGIRMSNRNENVLYLSDLYKDRTDLPADAIRYLVIKTASQRANISRLNLTFIEGGRKLVFKVGNLRRFFKNKGFDFTDYQTDPDTLSDYCRFMSNFDLKSALIWAESYVKEISDSINIKKTNSPNPNWTAEARMYVNALWALRPFIPHVVEKSIAELGINCLITTNQRSI